MHMSVCMWVHAGVVRCQIFEHSMFRENNKREKLTVLGKKWNRCH